MAVEFRLLGDVEARIDDHVVDVGHARQRCVLVALLVDANRPVPVEQLVDRVWADHQPQRARGALYNYLSRLRHALAATTDIRIVRQPGGYVLAVDPMTVDIHRFHRLTAQARAADSDEASAALFDQALGLWRGDAFATLDTPWLNSVRETLDRQRRAAELDRNDVALVLGRHATLLADLTTSANAHPLDERLAGQLMLALYRSGRQADALAQYQQLRLRLADELGADPGPDLRRLHQQILTADPAIAAASGARPGVGSPVLSVPRHLPAPPRSFVGRTDELAQLDAALTTVAEPFGTVVISAVSGTAGVGKTALAVHWAHRAAGRFPDGQLYVNLRGFDPTGLVMDPAEAVRGFLHALAVPPHRIPVDLDGQAALYRSELADKRILILLDNARDAEQVRPLLPGAPGCLVVVTSRNQLTSLVATDGAHPVALGLMSIDEARDLLRGRLGANRARAEPEAVEDIIASCARLPLALAIVAARAAAHPHFSLRALAAELHDARDRLDALAAGDSATDVRAVLSWSYHTLTVAAARLFRLLGLHPGPDISVAAAASLAGAPPSTVRPQLAELTRAHLIGEHSPGRYILHDLLRAYASEQAHITDPDDQRRAAVHRVLDHYLHSAHTAARWLQPARDPITLAPPQPGTTPENPADHEQSLAWFATEHRVLLAALDHAARHGFDTHTWQLAWTLAGFLYRRGHWHDWMRTQRAALAAARRLADLSAQATVHRLLAHAYLQMGCHDDAHTHLQHALDLHRQSADHVGQANTHLVIAETAGQQGRYGEALNHAQLALDLYQAGGHQRGQALALNTAGWYHGLLGHREQALNAGQRALNLIQELGDRDGEAGAWDSLGAAHHHLGHHAEAVACYQRAIDLYRDLGDRYNLADTLNSLGDTHHTAGHPDFAGDAWRHALTILDDLDHPDAEQVRTKLHLLNHAQPAGSGPHADDQPATPVAAGSPARWGQEGPIRIPGAGVDRDRRTPRSGEQDPSAAGGRADR